MGLFPMNVGGGGTGNGVSGVVQSVPINTAKTVDLGFQPSQVFISVTNGSDRLEFAFYQSNYSSSRYVEGYTGGSLAGGTMYLRELNNGISFINLNITSTGFTFTTKQSYFDNQDVYYYAFP